MYFYLTKQWYQHWSGKLFGVLGKNITWTYIEIHFTKGSLNADNLRYTADDLSTTLKLWCKLDEKVSQYFSVSFSDISSFHPTKHSLSSGQCINACDSVRAFKAHWLCCLAETAATNVRQHWYCEAIAYVEETFDFSRVSQCSWSCIKHYLFPICKANLFNCFHLALRTQFYQWIIQTDVNL